jgi:hypothetical protein
MPAFVFSTSRRRDRDIKEVGKRSVGALLDDIGEERCSPGASGEELLA